MTPKTAASRLCLCLALFASAAQASLPLKMENRARPWQEMEANFPIVKSEESRKSTEAEQQASGAMKGVEKGFGNAKSMADLSREMLANYKELSQGDKGLGPNYTPPGAPSVPSKCMEIKDCRPCFEKAHAGLNKSRMNLEKVRAHHSYTNRFTKLGQQVITAAGSAGGSVAALGASAENIKIDRALADFNAVVKAKNQELLEKLQTNLQEISACEAQYYKNEDWYDRYGFTYYQFMLSVYSY